MTGPKHQSDWKRLLRIACSLIEQANKDYKYIESWSFGGGTAMMLQIDHRESHDIDIFLNDPQLLGYLNPSLHDFDFELAPTGYASDGSNSLKLVFSTGEIDFIVGQSLTHNPTSMHQIDGVYISLETIPEIITKKVFYRGRSIKARDVFDIAAGAEHYADAIVDALREYPKEVKLTLEAIDRLNPEFVNSTIEALMLREKYKELSKSAIIIAKEVLLSV